jgi:hypothetical protein
MYGCVSSVNNETKGEKSGHTLGWARRRGQTNETALTSNQVLYTRVTWYVQTVLIGGPNEIELKLERGRIIIDMVGIDLL